MRWVFVLMIMANAFYALWLWQQPSGEGAAGSASIGVQVPTLQLVDEASSPGVGEKKSGGGPKSLVPEDEPAPLEQQCWYVGGFNEKSEADKAVRLLQAAQLQIRVDERQVDDDPDYWVHVGPFSSRAEAAAVLKKLRSRKIDSFLITDGELKNAISLGFFSKRSSADRLIARHRKLEYPVKVFVVRRYKTAYDLYVWGRVDESVLKDQLRNQTPAVEPRKRPKNSCI